MSGAGDLVRILHVEDSAEDAELALHSLRKDGLEFESRRVETRDAFREALTGFAPDLILTDYNLPDFDGMAALRLAKELARDVPVIITTGSVNEETAVACMKAGAADYVLKDSLGRLGTAVRAALEKQRLAVSRRRADEALRRSEAELRNLWRAVEQTPATVMITDLEARIIYVNPRFTEVTGYTAAEAQGQNPRILKSEWTNPETHRDLWETITAGRVWQGELYNVKKDGTLYWESASISPVRDEEGRTTHYVAVKDDITERKRAAEELEKTQARLQQAQKMEAVGRLAGGIAHDFNNLLTVIQGYGEILQASLAADSPDVESVDEILKAAQRAAALTKQLLAFSRQQVLETKVVDLGAVLGETEKMLERVIGEDVEVAFEKPANLGCVKADPGQLVQVLLNLAVNARDAMPEGGRLRITLAEESLDSAFAALPDAIPTGRYITLSVADTGIGMDAETLFRIFEPFFTTKEKGKGTGLGLATVYGIVRQSGGYVAVESAPGAGATFRIWLPRCDEPASSGERPSAGSAAGTETILLVEDEPSVRALARVVLERRGYTVLEAGNGAAALELVAGDPRTIDLLVTDLVMPGLNGRELASRVCALRPSIRVLFMSGYAPDVVPRVVAGGASGFLPKPFSERSLARKVREVLDGPPPAGPT